MKKIKLSADISTILYGIPIIMVFSTFMILIFGSVDSEVKMFYPILRFIGLILIIIWILLRQCKFLFFDSEFLYINSLFKKKEIRKVKFENVINVNGPFGLHILKIVYKSDNKEKRVFTILDRISAADESGFSSLPGYQFFYGKPKNKLLILRELISKHQEN